MLRRVRGSKVLTALWTAVGVLLTVLGLAGIPDDWARWGQWLSFVNHDVMQLSLVTVGVLIVGGVLVWPLAMRRFPSLRALSSVPSLHIDARHVYLRTVYHEGSFVAAKFIISELVITNRKERPVDLRLDIDHTEDPDDSSWVIDAERADLSPSQCTDKVRVGGGGSETIAFASPWYPERHSVLNDADLADDTKLLLVAHDVLSGVTLEVMVPTGRMGSTAKVASLP